MFKPLVISKDFCYWDNAAGRVDRDLWTNLSRHSFVPTVFCSDWQTNNRGSQDFVNSLSSSEIDLRIIGEIKYSRAIQSLFNRCPIPDFNYLPDLSYYVWGRGAQKEIEKTIKQSRYDYIDSLGMPHGSHLLALKLKKKYKLPWVARFYDPWTDNQYRKYIFNHYREKDIALEKEVAENADVIIHNNSHIAKKWRERYGCTVASKIKVLPMIFDWTRLPQYRDHKRKDGYLVISHIGNLFGVRNAQSLIYAINKLFARHPEITNNIKVNMIGWVPNKDKETIKNLGLDKVFNLTGRIPENECTLFFNETDLFVSIDGEGEVDLNYPSKLLKYFYYGRPILGLTLRNSVAAEELDNSGNYHVELNNIDGISEIIERAFFDYQSLTGYNHEYYMNFSPDKVVNEYHSIIKTLVKK